jgi:DNA-directed RNA polymerase subunit RPC12/RpoP
MKLTKELKDFFGKLHSLPEGTNIEIKDNVIVFEPEDTGIYHCERCGETLREDELDSFMWFDSPVYACPHCNNIIKY